MNREIRFRAYSKRDGMTYIDDLYFFEENGIHDFGGSESNDYAFTQFTGRKDKSGVPIFEHDVVLLNNGVHYIVCWYPDMDGWALFAKNGKHAHLGFVRTNDGIVVGNIYENMDFISSIADLCAPDSVYNQPSKASGAAENSNAGVRHD